MRARRAVGAAVFSLPVFTAVSSLVFTGWTWSWWVGFPALWQWWLMAWDMVAFPGDIPGRDKLGFLLGFLAGGGVVAGALLLPGGAGDKNNAEPIRRAKSPTHGDADWATAEQAEKRFPGSDPDYGGVVVAINHRRDLSPEAGVPFDPRKGETWGHAGASPLLVDPCLMRSTHSLWFAGSGIGKSQSILSTLAHPVHRFRGSWIGSDPKRELEIQTRRTREAMGQRVFTVGPSGGINIFDTLDPDSPDFEIDIQVKVSQMFTEAEPGKDADGDKWNIWGKQVVCALVADMMVDPARADEDRTPRALRAAVASGSRELQQVLAGIAEWSPSTFARQNARSVLLEDAPQTWTGIYANATAGTAWLSNPRLADMVSDRSFHPKEVREGDVTVYVQASPKQLKEAPGAARSIYGTLMSAVHDAAGMSVRAVFDIDESYAIGRMGIFELARDLGRSSGMTCRWWYQSVGQLKRLYGVDAVQTWYASCAYVAFAGVADMQTAQELAQMCGHYGAVVRNRSDNKGSSMNTGSFAGTTSRGSGTSESEMKKALEEAHDFIQKWADNEVAVVSRSSPVIRACLPLAFMLPDVAALLDPNPIEAAREAWRRENRERRDGLERNYREMALAA